MWAVRYGGGALLAVVLIEHSWFRAASQAGYAPWRQAATALRLSLRADGHRPTSIPHLRLFNPLAALLRRCACRCRA